MCAPQEHLVGFRNEIQARLEPIRTFLAQEQDEQVPIYFRPFVCDGDPYECRVMFVGFNSANTMPYDWSHYWSDSTGYLYQLWRHHAALSKTRRMIERIMIVAGPHRYITTNLYSIPTRRRSGLPNRYRTEQMEAVFRFLLHELNDTVRLIVPFGIDAVRWFEAHCDELGCREKIIWPFETEIERESCHFGYRFACTRADRIGLQLNQRL